MGTVGLNKEEDMEVALVEEEKKKVEEGENENGPEVVKWEKLIPKMVLTVLLVEADDSTRQIIASHLHKCNYKVATVSDGLKAWEILKRRHNNIDLILTELDLPSISGYALLTLIMEHDGCKNIPVIIMSSQDSISLVLKCMLKGAADFLIKPVRRNELKNLWRHAWRRLAMNAHGPHNLTIGQYKVEAIFENQPAIYHSSDNVSSSQKNSKSSEKATEAQSSCTTPYLEAESACMENIQDLSQVKHTEETGLNHIKMRHHHKNIKLEKELALNACGVEKKATGLASEGEHNEANVAAALRAAEDDSFTGVATEDGLGGPENCRHKTTCNIEVHEFPEPSAEAKNLIGAINKQKSSIHQSSVNGGLSSIYSTQELELSLRGYHDAKVKEVDETHKLNHSRASAFSWYSSNKKPCTTASVDDLKEINAAGDAPHSKIFNSNGEITHNILVGPGPQTSLPGVMVDGSVWIGYAPMLQPMQSPLTFPRIRSPNSSLQREESPFLTSPSLHSDPGSSQMCGTFGETADHFSCQTRNGFKNTESVEKHGLIDSPALDISGSCTDTQHKSSTNGSVSGLTDANATAPEMMSASAMDETFREDGGNTFDHDNYWPRVGYRSAEREAALAKFRLKRKGRFFEKKVRYQSRKKLAEQRPRVKGQFVRQAPNGQGLPDTDKIVD